MAILKLGIQVAVGTGIASQDNHPAGLTIEPMHDP
jgi:hypothetical protein